MVGGPPILRFCFATVIAAVVPGSEIDAGQLRRALRPAGGRRRFRLVARVGFGCGEAGSLLVAFIAAPLFLFVALSFAAGGLSGSLTQFLSSAVLFLRLGLNEELLYRGVIQHATNGLGPARSVVWVAVIFGLQHAGTVIFFGQPFYDTGAQIVSSTSFGAAYAAVRLRLHTIWPLAFCTVYKTSATLAVPSISHGGGTWWRRSSTLSTQCGCSAGSVRKV